MERGNEANCNCGKAMVQRTSWTDLNPGRRYVSCENFRRPGGCNFFVWADPPMCERSKLIIPGLLRRINTLETEIDKQRPKRFEASIVVIFVVIVVVCYLLFW